MIDPPRTRETPTFGSAWAYQSATRARKFFSDENRA